MTAERWRQVEELFHQAATLAPEERDPWITGHCTGDEELERELRRMLAADSSDGATIERMIGDSVTDWLDRPAPGQPERVGPWRIVKPIGAGGMGAVYLAARDDESYRQLAAVKILRAEQFAPGIHERFRQERQILAELDHPNIARLLDGGATPDGRPYLVLEYVDGVPLTQYAAKLSLKDRCALFATVCDAVAYAHRNLIVHRDLKPANILVDSQGAPKLLDFGIAKLIGVDHGMTSSMHALFTPDYASPEQVSGQSITTATDVYSLGAVLFELLTGRPIRTPGNRSFADLVKDVIEGDIPLPSRVATEKIPADLDRIVEKALAREPERRYGTADQLAADLRRHLTGLPVEARGHSFLYTASKFARRNWLPLSALLLLVTGLAASTVWSLQQAQIAAHARAQAEQERDRAERALAESDRQKSLAQQNAAEAATQRAAALDRFHSARKLTHKFLFDIEDALTNPEGITKARQILVSTALEHFEQMGREIDNDPALIRDLSRAYDSIGDLQGNSGVSNLGDFKGAVASYHKSLEWHRKLKQSPEDRLAEVETTMKLARMLKWVERIPEAEANFAAADRKLAALKPLWPAEKQSVLVVYRSNLVRGWSEHLQILGKHDKPRELLAESVADIQKALLKEPTSIRLRRGLAADAIALGRSQMELGEWRESIHSSELALATVREMLGPNPPTRETSRIHPPGIQLAEVLFRAPAPWTDVPRTLVLDRELIAIAEKLVSVDPANGRYRFLLANVLSGHGEHLRASWRWPEALSFYDRAVAEAEAVLVKAPDNAYYQDMLGTALALRGQLRFDMHDDQAAHADLTRGAAMLEKGVTAGRHFLDPQFHFAKDYLAILARERK
jgi:serine/threonine protein kinase